MKGGRMQITDKHDRILFHGARKIEKNGVR
jgi:hypothetical protein